MQVAVWGHGGMGGTPQCLRGADQVQVAVLGHGGMWSWGGRRRASVFEGRQAGAGLSRSAGEGVWDINLGHQPRSAGEGTEDINLSRSAGEGASGINLLFCR